MFGKSFLNGWFSDPIGSIMDAIQSVLIDPVVNYVNFLFGELLKIFYTVWATLADLLDAMQVIFGMLVGSERVVWKSTSGVGDNILGAEGDGVTYNIVIDVFMHEYVLGAFMKMLILGIFLLVIFTFIAIIKNEYSTSVEKAENKKGPIIMKSCRALVSFVCVPLVCIFGVIAAGYLMQALDGATSVSNDTTISNKLFVICTQEANRVRIDNDFYLHLSGKGEQESHTDRYDEYIITNDYEKFPAFSEFSTKEELADYIDNCFLYATPMPEGVVMTGGDSFANFYNNSSGIGNDKYFNCKNASQVFYFYDLMHFEWIVGLFTIFYIAAILVSMCLGAAARLYELAMLFIISPGIIAMYPINDNALKEWQKAFIGKTVMIFAPVIAINIYFILVGVLIQVDFSNSMSVAFTGGTGALVTGVTAAFIQQIFNLFVLIAGLQVCKSSIGTLSKLIGGDDIMATGDSIGKAVGNFVQTNAAAKYLMSKGSSAKGKLAAWGGDKVGRGKAKMHDAKDAVVNRKLNKESRKMQYEDDQKKRDTAVHEAQTDRTSAENAMKTNASDVAANTAKLQSDGLTAGDISAASATYQTEFDGKLKEFTDSGMSLTEATAKAEDAAFAATGLDSKHASAFKYINKDQAYANNAALYNDVSSKKIAEADAEYVQTRKLRERYKTFKEVNRDTASKPHEERRHMRKDLKEHELDRKMKNWDARISKNEAAGKMRLAKAEKVLKQASKLATKMNVGSMTETVRDSWVADKLRNQNNGDGKKDGKK